MSSIVQWKAIEVLQVLPLSKQVTFAIHVWDEPNPALMQIDVYSCAEFDPYQIAEKIKNDFDVVKIDYKYLNRETGLKPIRLRK